jgi:tetrahydromethanopterin S-methyltransferase subunit G
MGNELAKLGLVLSSKQVGALTQTEHSFQKFFHILKAIGGQIFAEVGPSFSFLIDKFAAFYQANKDLIGLEFSNFLHRFEFAMGYMAGLTVFLFNKWKKLEAAFNKKGMTLSLIGELVGLYAVVRVGSGLFGVFARSVRFLAGGFRLVTSAQAALSAALSGGTFLAAIGEAIGFLAVIGLIITAIHDLWALSQGQKTWTASLIEMVDRWRELRFAIEWVKTVAGDAMDAIDRMFKSLSGFTVPESLMKVAEYFEKIGKTIARDYGPVVDVMKKFMSFAMGDNPKAAARRKDADDFEAQQQQSSRDYFGGVSARANEATNQYYNPQNPPRPQDGDKEFRGPPRSDMMPQLSNFLGMQGGPTPDDRLSLLGSAEKAVQQLAQTFNVQGNQEITYNNDITINPPAGVDAKEIAHHTVAEIKRSHEYEKAKAAQSVGTPVSY